MKNSGVFFMKYFVIKHIKKNMYSSGSNSAIFRKEGKIWYNIFDVIDHIKQAKRYNNQHCVVCSNLATETFTKLSIAELVDYGDFCKVLKNTHYSYFDAFNNLTAEERQKFDYYLIFKNVQSNKDLKDLIQNNFSNNDEYKLVGNKIFLSDKNIALTCKLTFKGECISYDISKYKEIAL